VIAVITVIAVIAVAAVATVATVAAVATVIEEIALIRVIAVTQSWATNIMYQSHSLLERSSSRYNLDVVCLQFSVNMLFLV